MKLRILQLITDLEIGGAPFMVRDLALGLHADNRFDVHVACLAPPGHVARELNSRGVTTHCLNAKSPWDFRVFYRLAALITRFQPNILHCHLLHANVVGRLIGSALNVRHIIATVHTAERQKLWHLTAENLTCRLSRLTVCVSPSVRDHLKLHAHISDRYLKTIHNGIDTQKFINATPADLTQFNLSKNIPTLIFVGRLDPVKSVDQIIQAVSQLNQQNHPCQLLIVGDGPERMSLEKLTNNLNLTDRVKFAGMKTDVPSLLKAADLFIQPSKTEGLPLVTLEAMAAGIPIVASRTAGIIDLLDHQKSALLTPPGNQNSLTHSIQQLLTNPTQAQKLSRTAQQHVLKNFSSQAMFHAYTDLYQNLC